MNQLNQILELAVRYLAGLLDGLKAKNPLLYLALIALYAGAEAFIQNNDLVGGVELSDQVKQIANYVLIFLAGITGTRTTRYIKKEETEECEEKELVK